MTWFGLQKTAKHKSPTQPTQFPNSAKITKTNKRCRSEVFIYSFSFLYKRFSYILFASWIRLYIIFCPHSFQTLSLSFSLIQSEKPCLGNQPMQFTKTCILGSQIFLIFLKIFFLCLFAQKP